MGTRMPDVYDYEDDEFDAGEDAYGDAAMLATWANVPSAFGAAGGGAVRGASTKKTVAKTGATAGNTASSLGVTVASAATGTHSLAVAGAIAAGAAVSATGVGLVVVGAALSLTSMTTNATSMVKSSSHVVKLKRIQSALGNYAGCEYMPGAYDPTMADDHAAIGTIVLPYIIRQKTEKAVKKGVGIVPGGGLLTNAMRFGRIFKKNRGKKRTFYAHVLTRHLITHDCQLAGAIVAQLFSAPEMLSLRAMDSDTAGALIAKKMKSV